MSSSYTGTADLCALDSPFNKITAAFDSHLLLLLGRAVYNAGAGHYLDVDNGSVTCSAGLR